MRCQSIRTITDLGRSNSDKLERWISECDILRGTSTGNLLSAMLFAIMSWTCDGLPNPKLPQNFPEFPSALPPLPLGIPSKLQMRLVQADIGCQTLPKEVVSAVQLGLQPIIVINMYHSLQKKLLRRIQSSVLNVQIEDVDFGANRQILEDSMSGTMQEMTFALAHLEHQTFPGVKLLFGRHTFSVANLTVLDPCRRGIQFYWVDVIGLAEVDKERANLSSMLQSLEISKQKSDRYAIILRDNKVPTVEALESYGAKSIPALMSFLQNKIGMNQKEMNAIKLQSEQKNEYILQLNLFAELLSKVPLFKDNTAEEILEMAKVASCVSFREKEPIVHQCELGMSFYVILDGHVTVHVKGIGQVADLGPKKFFGEIALVKDVPRTATCIAHKSGPIKCKCMVIQREAFSKARMVAAENNSNRVKKAAAQKRCEHLLSSYNFEGLTIRALLQYRDLGAVYNGTIDIHGNEHGYGSLVADCSFSYDGTWLDGKPHGLGRFTSTNGSVSIDQEWIRGFPEDALSLFGSCSEEKLCQATLYQFAMCYLQGLGIKQDQIKAMEILKKLHSLGHCDSSFLVACSMESLTNDADGDVQAVQSQAFEIFASGASKGHVPSQYRAALCLDAGRGVAKNEKEAFALLFPLASQGHAAAQYHIGVYYECGLGVSPDHEKSKRWLHWSSQQGYFPAMRRVCVLDALYPEGNAVWPDDND
jgi:TPR repeat protein